MQFWWNQNGLAIEPNDPDLRAQVFREIVLGRVSRLIISPDEMPAERLIARFLAKISMEFLATRVISTKGWEEFLVDDRQLDPIRRFARQGDKPDFWPFSIRKIYDEDAIHIHADGDHQVLHEFDFLVTPHSEYYGVLCLFGVEMAINCGGPEIEGYQRWLCDNQGSSPLYIKEELKLRNVPAGTAGSWPKI